MSNVDFRQALSEAGVPTTDAALRKAWEAEVAAQGSKLSNTGNYSPFWRVITALVTNPVLWLINFISDTVLPNFFVKTARGAWLDSLAWAVNVTRKGATKAQGRLLFTRENFAGELRMAAGVVVNSTTINGNVYQLVTVDDGVFPDGRLQVSVKVEARQVGSGYNLAPGYYAILSEPLPGIVQVVNTEDWLESPGADPEVDGELRLRVRNQFSAVNQWHTDAVYRAMIASFPGVRPDGIYFEHGAPRGPGSANAYVLFEAGVPAVSYLDRINAHIRDDGNHGHGDDLLALVMPTTEVGFSVYFWPKANTSPARLKELSADIELFVRAAFRESTSRDYKPTLTYPQSRFSMSRLMEELHQEFADIESMRVVPVGDIISGMSIPRLKAFAVVPN